MSAPVAVVHLVRQANGLEPFDAFMDSYRRMDPELEHDLVLLLKGFSDRSAHAAYRERCTDLAPAIVELPDTGFDLTAYLAAAALLDHARLCFLNSFSEILAPGWLRLLDAALEDPAVGAAGASGSWASHRSFALSLLRLPNGYGAGLGDRRRMVPALRSTSTAPKVGLARRLVRAGSALPVEIAGYPGFPAPHLRTNAFVIERRLLLSLRARGLERKSANYRFEAGRASLTAQLRARGLATLLVGRDGTARPYGAWPDADLFWQGTQRDLLVADNQTRQYDAGGPAVREALSRYAWGPRARPG